MALERRLLAVPSFSALLALAGTGCPCPECPPPEPEPAARLVLEDTHTAAWMTFDNKFVSNPGTIPVCKTADVATEAGKTSAFGKCKAYSTAFRAGILFQIGHVVEKSGDTDHFDYVELTFSNQTLVKIDESDFDWLDVNALSDCAIDPLHAYSLFQNKVVAVDCDGATLSGYPETCLRQRALHASLRPDVGIVTYWPGAGYYAVKSDAGGHAHIAHSFALKDPVTVDRWQHGCFQERYEGVVKLRIAYYMPSQDHAGYPHSPIDGGNYTPQ